MGCRPTRHPKVELVDGARLRNLSDSRRKLRGRVDHSNVLHELYDLCRVAGDGDLAVVELAVDELSIATDVEKMAFDELTIEVRRV